MDVLLRCSKWLLGAWLDSFTWSWDADWSSESNEPAPLSLWHCDPELCSMKSGSIERTAHFMGRPTPLKVNGANFSTLLPPRGATFTPFWGMVLQSLPASSMWPISHSVNSTLWATRHQIFFAMLSQWGKFGTLLPPRGATFTHFEVWSYRACQPLQMWQISNFCEIHSLSYEASKFFSPC